MKALTQIAYVVTLCLFLLSVTQCSSIQKLQNEAPITIKEAYSQSWIAGVKGGGAGLNIFITTQDTLVKLDSVYFRGKGKKLELKRNNTWTYVGRFPSSTNSKKEIILHLDPMEEFGNEPPIIDPKIPFELDKNECVVSYNDSGKTKYFKITDIKEKRMIPFPRAKENKQ